jgi:hypothetical protein
MYSSQEDKQDTYFAASDVPGESTYFLLLITATHYFSVMIIHIFVWHVCVENQMVSVRLKSFLILSHKNLSVFKWFEEE